MQKRNSRVVESYRENFPTCEVAGWWLQVAGPKHADAMQMCEAYRDKTDGQWLDCPVVHHILGGINRFDVPTNLITICGYAHDWIHTQDPIAGRIVCWRVKLTKCELDRQDILDFARIHVAGWLERDDVLRRCELNERLDQWRREILDFCGR